MKNSAFLFCLFLIISCSSVSNKPTESTSLAGVDGWWTGEFQGAHLLYHFKGDGGILTGTADGMPGIPLLHLLYLREGKIENDNIISFRVETDYGGNKLRADYKGDLKDDEIRFNFTTTLTGPQADSGGNKGSNLLLAHGLIM